MDLSLEGPAWKISRKQGTCRKHVPPVTPLPSPALGLGLCELSWMSRISRFPTGSPGCLRPIPGRQRGYTGALGSCLASPHPVILFVSVPTGVIKLKNNGDFFIANEGRRPIYIDGRPVLCGSKWRLSNNSVVEVSWEGGGEVPAGPAWGAVSQSAGLAPSPASVLSRPSLLPRLPACDLSSSSTRTSSPLSGPRLPRSHHSESGGRTQGL